jgi:ABC-2 type transport system permease protein
VMQGLSNIWAIVQKELKHYFFSPIAYVVMMIFLTLSGYFFHFGLLRFMERLRYFKGMMQFYQNQDALAQLNLNEWVIAPALFNMIFVFLFLLPLIMMRSFAEEKKQKTDELLMTSPLTTNQILMGKFFGAFVFVVILLMPTVAYQVVLFVLSKPELGPVACGYLGVVLFAACGISIGLFASSLTENQIIAAVITFVIVLFMFIINFVGGAEGTLVGDIVKYVGVAEHLKNLLRGTVDTRDLVYFLSIIFLFLFLTKRSLESVSWR